MEAKPSKPYDVTIREFMHLQTNVVPANRQSPGDHDQVRRIALPRLPISLALFESVESASSKSQASLFLEKCLFATRFRLYVEEGKNPRSRLKPAPLKSQSCHYSLDWARITFVQQMSRTYARVKPTCADKDAYLLGSIGWTVWLRKSRLSESIAAWEARIHAAPTNF